jgi:type II secretory pathway component GspD/PulD (secretin)
MRSPWFPSLIMLIAGWTVSPAMASDPPPSTSLSGQLDIARLVDLAAARVGVSVTYDGAAVTGQATVRAGDNLSDLELWDLASQALLSRGFAAVQTPGAPDKSFAIVRIVEAAGVARVEDARDVGEALFPLTSVPPGYASVVLRPRHATAKDLLEAIRPLVSKAGGSASELGKDGLLLISDATPRLLQLSRVLETLDQPAPDVVIEEYRPTNLNATALSALVTSVSGKADLVRGRKLVGDVVASSTGASVLIVAPRDGVATWRAFLQQLDQRPGVETRTYTPSVFAVRDVAKLIEQQAKDQTSGAGGAVADDRWRLVVDELTGSLIVTATLPQHEQIDAILARLESVQRDTMPVRSYPIRNRPVADVLATLSKLIDAGVLDAQTQEAPAPSSALLPTRGASAESPIKPTVPSASDAAANKRELGREGARDRDRGGSIGSTRGNSRLTLTADDGTNTLIAVGEPRLLSQLETLLQTIDVRQPQVMLEVMLVSMNDSDAKSLGVELERISTSGGITSRVSSLFGLSTPATAAGGATRNVGDAAGFTGAVLNPGEFSVVVRAIETVNKGRQSSLPRVLVNNNEQAQFSSTLQQPVTTQRATDQTTTTSFAGFEDAGTKISIRPQIAEGDHLVLQYSLSLSSFIGSATGGIPPARQQNEVDSIATIPDGHTVVVGGLELVTDGDSESRIPLLGRLPLLGNLFKNQGRNLSTTRFYVFIRATVLRDQGFEDLKYLSSKAAQANNVDEGWPVVEPRVIE